ncbi:hypothetical protein BGZ83_007573 [Gryganskiella cystojenkinii]|nr:hypothetical protein BGZ83_007573 [Gryganskiella cystojenkinii]
MAQQKVSFKKWWKNITGSKADKGLFNIDLVDSISYAGVPVSYTIGTQTRCQGFIPTIVSKCGWFLKEQATKTRGIFRVSGSAKRVAELQLLFDTPPNYGSQLDWSGYTIHDASNVLRRYLNHLPDPVIPLEFYEKFRDVHRNMTEDEEMTSAYQELISKLPDPHAWLLMYLLDLLSLFAYHSAENLMDSKNLASVFQPGVLSHPNHAMSPGEYMTSAAVLKFLIEHQSSFTLPETTFDEDDKDMAHFGLSGQAIQNFPDYQRQSIGAGLHGGFVNAEDHEQLYDSRTAKSVGFEPEDSLRCLDSGIRRQLSLQKPIIPHSTLPGHAPQRSRSTNSSTSSHRSHQSNVFSSAFLTKRRSNRNSKTASKIGQDFESLPPGEHLLKEQDLSDIAEASKFSDEHARSLTPQSASLKKAQTMPVSAEDPNPDFSSYLALRKQLQSEGLSREPSIFCQTIEIQFPAPLIDVDRPASFKPSPPVSLRTSPVSSNVEQRMSQMLPKELNLSTTAHIHIPDPPIRPLDDGYSSQASGRRGAALKRTSGLNAPASNVGVPILRAKSNPGEMTHVSTRSQSRAATATGSQVGGSGHHAMEKIKGLFTGRHRDHDDAADPESKENRRDSKRESVTEKQRKYKSQEVSPSHLQADQRSGSWRGTPLHSVIDESHDISGDWAYIQPPPPIPRQQQPTSAPPRPRPPPPEGSLMDLLDMPQRHGHQPGHSTPSAAPTQDTNFQTIHHSPRHLHLDRHQQASDYTTEETFPHRAVQHRWKG